LSALVKLNRIYTRTGDDGTTGLGDGARRLKDDPRVSAYGEIDELNSTLGLVRLSTAESGEADLLTIDRVLARVQNDLFDLGADLCVPPQPHEEPGSALRVTQAQVDALEAAIDALNVDLAPLTSFVLPGGSPAAAALHLARTVCRRAERALVTLASIEGEVVGAPAIKYVNRLSDYLFVASRFANRRGADDILWKPGANR
jgi:cob(I)alamin adenosyltransferase